MNVPSKNTFLGNDMAQLTKVTYGIALSIIYVAVTRGITSLVTALLLLAFVHIGWNMIFMTFIERKSHLPKLLDRRKYLYKNLEHDEATPNVFDKYPEISNELQHIVHLIIRDYVTTWFERIDPDPKSKFPKELNKVLLKVISDLTTKLNDSNITNLILLKLVPLVTLHFNSFTKAKRNLIENLIDKHRTKPQIPEYRLIIEYEKLKCLHSAIHLYPDNLEKGIESHFRKIVSRILPHLVSPKELDSPFVAILMREILTTNILTPLVAKYSEPDNWNLAFISLSRRVLKERNQIHKVRRILMKEIQEPRAINDYEDISKIKKCAIDFNLTATTTTKEFETYLRQLSLLNSFSDLRSMKFALSIKLLKLKNKYERVNDKIKMPKAEIGLKKRLIVSLNMLDTKLKYIEPKMSISTHSEFDKRILEELEGCMSAMKLDVTFFHDKLCVSFFRRFLTMNNFLDSIVYLDFWLLVDSFKNPLEDVKSQEILIEFSTEELSNLLKIKEQFLVGPNLQYIKKLDEGLVHNIELFTETLDLRLTQAFSLARRSVFLLQEQARIILSTKHYTMFKKSNIILKMIAAPEFSSSQVYATYFSSIAHEESSTKITESSNDHKKNLNNVIMFSNPYINEALQEIVNGGDEFDIRNGSFQESEEGKGNNKHISSSDAIFSDRQYVDSEEPTELNVDSDVDMSGWNIHGNIYSDLHDVPSDSIASSYISDTMNDHRYDFATLKHEIYQLSVNIEQISKELDLLRHLLLKADLMDNKQQLKLLKKSQRSLTRDLEKKEMLRQQLTIQENANSLFQKTTLRINYYYINSQISNMHDVVFYIINVDHVHNQQATSWEIPRRYSEFYELNKYLRKQYSTIFARNFLAKIFPPKVNMSWKSNTFIKNLYDERQRKFEVYLGKLVQYPEICQDDVFRRFLTDTVKFQVDVPKHSVSISGGLNNSGTDNQLVIGRPVSYKSFSETSSQASGSDINTGDGSLIVDPLEIKLNKSERKVENVSNSSFLKPICDLFISVFSLNKSNSLWLRGGAIILVLQQLFGGTIEKYIKDSIIRMQSPESVRDYLVSFRLSMWGADGVLERRKNRKEAVERTSAEKKKTRKDSRLLLEMLLVEICGKVVGRKHAQEAGSKIHELVQIRSLNASILLEIIDVVLEDFFPQEAASSQT